MKILIAAGGRTMLLSEQCSLTSFALGHGWPSRSIDGAQGRATDGSA
jgi:hypothetical protein